ncbi:MAG: integration host factor subunit beta [Spirochaetaceae bacterium]|nr:integration host factor subunit beta [Spirochaetaceae bacterium]MBO7485702.1 integration host factor subunit beta [Spirochaetaceae bacterium]MBP5329449.1 integration host factor subunit beta [Spirochaetaceae bacterium]
MAQNKITKVDLVESVYLDTSVEKKVVQEVFDSLLDRIKGSLKNASVIELRGFGTFELRLRKGRKKARNPRTGESVSVEPHSVVAFRAGKELRSAVWGITDIGSKKN